MKKFKPIKKQQLEMNTDNAFDGESIEEKVRKTLESNAPVEAISPMIYTERKDGVRADTNIRTDRWDVAQQAMHTIADGKRQKREEASKTAKSSENPSHNGKMDVPAENA